MDSLSPHALFPRPSLNFILGTFGSKKTWLALDLAVSVALGRGWLDFCQRGEGVKSSTALGSSRAQRRKRPDAT